MQHTWIQPATCVCLVFVCVLFLCVVLHLGGARPPSRVLLPFVGFLFPLVCPFIPFCSSVAVMTLRRPGHARTGIPFFPYVCGGEHRHSFGVTSCWFSCRCGFRCAFRGGALWRCLTRNFLVLRLLRRYAYNIWHITYLFLGGRWRCCCLCVLFMHDMQHTCAASFFFCCDLLRVLQRRRIPYASGLALLGRALVVYLHRGAVRYILVLSLSTSYRVVYFFLNVLNRINLFWG